MNHKFVRDNELLLQKQNIEREYYQALRDRNRYGQALDSMSVLKEEIDFSGDPSKILDKYVYYHDRAKKLGEELKNFENSSSKQVGNCLHIDALENSAWFAIGDDLETGQIIYKCNLCNETITPPLDDVKIFYEPIS